MAVMVSTPPSGTLRTTRVTSATIVLAAALSVGAVVVGVLVGLGVASGRSPLFLLAEVPIAALAVGCGDLAAYGVRQRALLRSGRRGSS